MPRNVTAVTYWLCYVHIKAISIFIFWSYPEADPLKHRTQNQSFQKYNNANKLLKGHIEDEVDDGHRNSKVDESCSAC